jgi:hypothetical protein
MNVFRGNLALILVIAMTGVSSAITWHWNGWFGPRVDTDLIAARVEGLPAEVGNWKSAPNDHSTFDDEVIRMLDCKGYISRTYRHEQTGEVVQVAVLYGAAGPMSAHTPEVCYSTRDYQMTVRPTPTKVEYDQSEGEFMRMQLRSPQLSSDNLAIYYAWSDGKTAWRSPRQPRFAFGGQGYLHKIQLACNVSDSSGQEHNDAGKAFLREFLPVVDQQLFAEQNN